MVFIVNPHIIKIIYIYDVVLIHLMCVLSEQSCIPNTLGYVVNLGNVQNGILRILFLVQLPMFGMKPEHTALNTASHNAMQSI